MRKSAIAAQARLYSSIAKKDVGKQSKQTKVTEFEAKKSVTKSRASKKK